MDKETQEKLTNPLQQTETSNLISVETTVSLYDEDTDERDAARFAFVIEELTQIENIYKEMEQVR